MLVCIQERIGRKNDARKSFIQRRNCRRRIVRETRMSCLTASSLSSITRRSSADVTSSGRLSWVQGLKEPVRSGCCVPRKDRRMSRILSAKPLKFLGKLSFCSFLAVSNETAEHHQMRMSVRGGTKTRTGPCKTTFLPSVML